MKMIVQPVQQARVKFQVRLVIKESDLKKMRGERMNPHLTHIDTVIELGSEDFSTDDERLFAVDFEQTLYSERDAGHYGSESIVPATVVLQDIGYPVDGNEVAAKVVNLLRSGVEEGTRREEEMAKVKTRIVAARQMIAPAVARFAAAKLPLAKRCEAWAAKQQAATQAMDVKQFQKLKAERESLEREIPEEDEVLYKELAAQLEQVMGEGTPRIEWRGSAVMGMTSVMGGSVERSATGKLESSLRATVGSGWGERRVEVVFKAAVVSPLYRRWSTKESLALEEVEKVLDAFDLVRKDESEKVFEAAAKRARLKSEAQRREDWIAEHGSPALKTALAQKLPFMSLYARERFVAKCKAAGADLSDFVIDVDPNLFSKDGVKVHHDPSTRAMMLIGGVAAEVPEMGVGRLTAGQASVKAENDEVITVPGASIDIDCPYLYLWRKMPTGRGKR